MMLLSSLLLVILGSRGCMSQWISSGSHEWEVSLTPESTFSPSLLSVRSSEERPLKSPLSPHDSSAWKRSSLPLIEVHRITGDQGNKPLKNKRKKQILSRRRLPATTTPTPSPVPSADDWWKAMQSDRNQQMVRIVPYEYPPAPTYGTLEASPDFITYPISYHNKRMNRKRQFKKAQKPAESEVELERVSHNPPEFAAPEASMALEANLPMRFRKNKQKKVPALGRVPIPSERLGSVVSESDDSGARPLTPDRMLGNDMMNHPNRLEEVGSLNSLDDDPNEDFELIK